MAFGRDNVTAFFENRGLDVWSIFQGKQFVTAGDGKESLEEFLTMLEPGGSQALYTLKVYTGVSSADEVTEKTPANGSFNFKLSDVSMMSGAGNAGMYAQIVALKKEIADLKEGKEKEKKTFGDVVMGWCEDPQDVIQIIGAVRLLLGKPAVGQLAGVSAPGETIPAQTATQVSKEQEAAELATALNQLEQQDPKIVAHLCKLAELSKTNPPLFNMLIKNLDAI